MTTMDYPVNGRAELLFLPDDIFNWSAHWIAPSGADLLRNCYFRVRKHFIFDGIPRDRVLLRIAAANRFIVYINGKPRALGPIRGTKTLSYYDIYDIAPWLGAGENRLEILVHTMNTETYIVDTSAPGVIAEIEGVTATDHTWECVPERQFRSDVMFYTEQTGFCQWRDQRIESAWQQPLATTIEVDAAFQERRLTPRDISALRENYYAPAELRMVALTPPCTDEQDIRIAALQSSEKYSEASVVTLENPRGLLQPGEMQDAVIHPPGEGRGVTLVLDFQREMIGYLDLEITAPTGTIIDINYDEDFSGDRLRSDYTPMPYHFCDRQISGGDRQSCGNILYDRGLRMVQITLREFTEPIRIHRVGFYDLRYDFGAGGGFFSSDYELNRIYDVGVETLRACATDAFLDCPWRERAFWVNDLVVENAASLAVFGPTALHKRSFSLALSQPFDDEGLIPGMSPSGSFDNAKYVLYPTNLLIILALYDYYWYSGDQQTVRQALPAIVRILDSVACHVNSRGQLVAPERYWNFLDWSFEQSNRPLNHLNTSLVNFLYVIALQKFSELLERTAGEMDRAIYSTRIEATARFLEVDFFDRDRQVLVDFITGEGEKSRDFSQLGAAFALLSGILSPAATTAARRQLVSPDALSPELYLHSFIFAALAQTGDHAEVLRRIRLYWGRNVATGTPTFWESGVHRFGKAAFGGYGSLCHGFATAPLIYLAENVLGIRPLEPGFRRFELNSEALQANSELPRHVRGAISTPEGKIFVEWNRNEDGTVDLVDFRCPKGFYFMGVKRKIKQYRYNNVLKDDFF